ncbi:hypothetical membrane protein [Anaerolinea thermophila UNI-1]|uniref:Hypothetical membrane protein n=2 Tax=Anaerolinea thermophila TaxID=167964 RepID=E8N210_ANATU|nr:hypothetical membrane protein [Anaerolinea thermophila UNI-1]
MTMRRSSSFAVGVILLSLALALGYMYYLNIEKNTLDMRLDLHRQIVQGSAPSPYQYRVLVPFLAEGLFRVERLFFPDYRAFALSYIVLNVGALFLWLWAGFRLLRVWYRTEYALIGTLFVAAVTPLTFYDHYFQPWSFWEAFFYILSLMLMAEGRWGWLAGVVLLASLNRETAVLILPAFALTMLAGERLFNLRGWQWTRAGWLALYALLWGGVFLALRGLRPATQPVETLAQIWQFNIQPAHLFRAGVNWVLFLGGFWLMAFLAYRRAPLFLQRAGWVLVFHLPLILVWGYWQEVRMLLPHAFVFVGLGLAVFPEALKPSPPPSPSPAPETRGAG